MVHALGSIKGRIMWDFRHGHGRVWRRCTRRPAAGESFLSGKQHDAIAAWRRPAGPHDVLAPTAARRQADPTKPVTLLIAFPPGGPSDVLSRVVGKKLEQILGQPFIMDNRPGAGGNIAAEAAAHAVADGDTILMGNNSILATNAALYKKVNFDPETDFAPISLIGSQANILVVNPNMPVKSLAELIALLRANPGKFNYASSGHGTAAHLAAELFKAEAKVEITHVPTRAARRRCRT